MGAPGGRNRKRPRNAVAPSAPPHCPPHVAVRAGTRQALPPIRLRQDSADSIWMFIFTLKKMNK